LLQDVIHFAYKVDKKESSIARILQSAGKIASSIEFIARTKHIEVAHLWIQQEVAKKRIKVHHVNSENQAADIFTKSLARPLFEKVQEKTWIDIIKGNVTYHFLLLLDLEYHTTGGQLRNRVSRFWDKILSANRCSRHFALKIATSDF
jgi:hypothetical protein